MSFASPRRASSQRRAFFALFTSTVAGVVAFSFAAACSSNGANNTNNNNSEGGANGTEGGLVDGVAPGDGGGPLGDGSPVDAGPKPYGTIPVAPPTTYNCVAEIHVATTGSDTNDGKEATPYKTIAKAAPLAKPGECIKVHTGLYAESTTIAFGVDGTPDKPIVLVAADGRGSVIIDGATNTTGSAVDVKFDYIVIDGFEFKGTPTTSEFHVVRFDGSYNSKCKGSILRNNKLTGGLSQLKIFQKTQGILVEYNEFYGAAGNVPLSLTGASGLTFRANYCHDWDSGENGAAQVAGGSTDVLFEKNLFQDILTFAGTVTLGDACGPTCDNDPEHFAAVNARAINNLFIRVPRPFDLLGCKNCAVLSNTLIDSGQNLVVKIGIADTNGTKHATVDPRILNNLISAPTGVMTYITQIDDTVTGLKMDYNLIFNGPNGFAYGQNHAGDLHSVVAGPALNGPSDFRPGGGSPAIGAGFNTVVEVPNDFLGAVRPAVGFDIGAFQH